MVVGTHSRTHPSWGKWWAVVGRTVVTFRNRDRLRRVGRRRWRAVPNCHRCRVPVIMTGHLAFPGLDPDGAPATLSEPSLRARCATNSGMKASS